MPPFSKASGDRVYSLVDGERIVPLDHNDSCNAVGMQTAVLFTREDMDTAFELCPADMCWIGR